MGGTSSAKVLALADDATGALETGAQFAAQGIATAVALRGDPLALPGAPAVVIDTETRHAPPAGAREAARAWTAEARRRGIALLYKKTDSTLRGNIAAEFAGMLAAFPEASLVYVPAYPKLGRRVRGGRVYVAGLPLAETHFARDPRNPVREDRIPELLGSGAGCPVGIVPPGELNRRLPPAQPCMLVCDAESDGDLETIAGALRDCRSPLIVAGPGGFAGVWARSLPLPRTATRAVVPSLPCLAVNGSLHPLSLAQVRGAGCAPHRLSSASPSDITAEIRSTGFAVLTTAEAAADDPGAVARRLASLTRAVLQAVDVCTLVIFGGDTAMAILDELGIHCVRPAGEIQDGVPVSSMRVLGREIALITKAGGFGEPDTLAAIRRILERQP